MLLLSIDTSGREGALTLARGSDDACVPLATRELSHGDFSGGFFAALDELFADTGTSKRELTALVVVNGPGSFTGLRIGIAAAKGLATTLHLPVIAVTSLEALAATGRRAGRVMAVLDASRGECYAGVFELGKQSIEQLVPVAELAQFAKGQHVDWVAVKQAEYMELMQDFNVDFSNAPLSHAAAAIGCRRHKEGKSSDISTLDAHYVRRDHELFFTTK